MARFLLTPFGSLGDLHPLLALGFELRLRGHRVAIATSEYYRDKVSELGFDFFPMRPEIKAADPELIARLMDPRGGAEMLLREVIFPHVRAMYDDVMAAAEADGGAAAIVAGELVYVARSVAETLGIKCVTAGLSPMNFFSAYDPPVIPGMAWMERLMRGLGPWAGKQGFAAMRRSTRAWVGPLHALRRDLGLPALTQPMWGDHYGPDLTLALFSREIGEPQPDWPAKTVQTGFTFYDGAKPGADGVLESPKLSAELENFLTGGEEPIVFTLGSAAVHDPGTFFDESARAAQILGRRALLVMGHQAPSNALPPSVMASPYAPYSLVFPRAAAIVHQGGVGTTAQAMRAGKPMLFMPYNFDQYDNAARMVRRGVARTIERGKYSALSAARELRELVVRKDYAARAAQMGKMLEQENGTRAACDAIERVSL